MIIGTSLPLLRYGEKVKSSIFLGIKMIDIILESIRAAIVFLLLVALIRGLRDEEIRLVKGWRCLLFGFCLIFLGSLIDITDNFDGLSKYLIIGDTGVQFFVEKVVGYLLGFTLVATGIYQWLPRISEHQRLIQENLTRAEEEIRVLRGIIPICMHCNNIRDDDGGWKRFETYIERSSEAKFSHSICDDCLDRHYPEDN